MDTLDSRELELFEESKNKGKTQEEIECPECGKVQIAIIQHTIPFWTYFHYCESCMYPITESDWNKTNK